MNNEEKILAILEEHSRALTEQGKALAEQGKVLAKQEERLEVICADISEMQQTLAKVAVTQEAVVLPKIQLLFDGHVTLAEKMDTLTPRNRVEELEEDVTLLKDAVRLMRLEIAELKRAR